MSAGITLEEMLAWNDQASAYWKAHFDANPILLDLHCGIGGAANVQEFVRHIWGAELRWAQRLLGPAPCRRSGHRQRKDPRRSA
jgi:hypothetical protein